MQVEIRAKRTDGLPGLEAWVGNGDRQTVYVMDELAVWLHNQGQVSPAPLLWRDLQTGRTPDQETLDEIDAALWLHGYRTRLEHGQERGGEVVR